MRKVKRYFRQIGLALRNVKYAILYRVDPEHKYHLLDTGLPPNYYDLDMRILYAVMNNFVKLYKNNSHSFFTRDCNWDTHPEILNADELMAEYFNKDQRQIKDDLDKVYDWWVDRYLKITKDHEDYWDGYVEPDTHDYLDFRNFKLSPTHKQMFDIEEELEKEADEMLQLLMKHRRCLWD